MRKRKLFLLIPALALLLCACTLLGSNVTGYALYSTDATTIRVIPLQKGEMPDVESGKEIAASATCASDLASPPELHILPGGDFVAVWGEEANVCYSRFTGSYKGGFTETEMGDWAASPEPDAGPWRRWEIADAADLNGDGLDDLLLVLSTGERDRKDFVYQVALGTENGSFAFGEPTPITFEERFTYFALSDIDGDETLDMIFHSAYGGEAYKTRIYVINGLGDGTFAAEETKTQILISPHSSTSIVPGDFDQDGDLDIFLPPDDDIGDRGQAYMVLQGEDQTFTLEESIDLDPENERMTWDKLSGYAQTLDVDADGYLDIVCRVYKLKEKMVTWKIYPGDGSGQFLEPVSILSASYADAPEPVLIMP